jgi:2-C-methyl-D-erythritol 4-phosphate cytidylyltransferase
MGGHPKALLVLGSRSLLEHGIARILPHVDEVVAAVGPNELPEVRPEFEHAFNGKPVRIVAGGQTRQGSLLALLKATTAEWVLIHEVARPLTPEDLFPETLAAARLHGAAVTFRRHKERDSIGLVNGDSLECCVPRSNLVILQTPHAYRRDEILAAHQRAIAEGWKEEGTAPLALRARIPIHLVECLEENLKITYPEDWDQVSSRTASSDPSRAPARD